ncbi:Fe-S metabolism associated domain [Parasponia andersonii]|uniref:Fe-S metabolism associated domain n=1 Tax=Parasponia andersonii TaxID=3476 RepID=A0A2P5CTA1_PARAD|nr:Fe-S metabolism associated domain [Parasponia andersonii]
MNSSIIRTSTTPPPPPQCSISSSSRPWIKGPTSISGRRTLSFRRENERKSLRSSDSGSNFSSRLNARNPSLVEIGTPSPAVGTAVADRLHRLVLEFKSLEEPMDRVKRLLHYASRLPPYDESGRVAENRVVGCATQVWVEAEMEEGGRMRFRADSDSEISKGFCSCLIWVLDGGEAEEVLGLKTEDFEYVNVGLHGRGHSRVNTWHNVLITMQKKTRALLEEKNEKPSLEPSLSSIMVSPGYEISAQNHGGLAQTHASHYLLSLSVTLPL